MFSKIFRNLVETKVEKKRTSYGENYYICKACKNELGFYKDKEYCPKCGRKIVYE